MRSLASILLTSVCVLSFQALNHDVQAKSPHSWSGKLSAGISTDRNAGAAGGKVRGPSAARDDDDEDEEEDSEVFDDDDLTGDDLLDDLDLDEPELQATLDEVADEADGVVGNEDFDGDGQPDGDPNAIDPADEGGNPAADEGGNPAADAGGDPAADAGGDPAADAGGDPAADAGGDPAARTFPAGFTQSAATKGAKRPPKGKSGARLSLGAGVGHKYAIDKETLWKTGASFNSANQREQNKNDSSVFAASTGPEFKILGGDVTWGPSIAYARAVKDNKHVLDLYAAALGVKYKINKKLGFKTKYTYSGTKFQSSRADESYGQKIALALAAKPFKKTTTELGWSFKTVDVSPASKEKDTQDITFKFQQDFDYKIYLAGKAAYKWSQQDAIAKKTDLLRNDNEYNFGVSLGKEVYKGVNMELQYDHRNLDTNIRNKDVSNDRWALVTGWTF